MSHTTLSLLKFFIFLPPNLDKFSVLIIIISLFVLYITYNKNGWKAKIGTTLQKNLQAGKFSDLLFCEK